MSKLRGLEHRIQTVDSQAFGIASRIEARQRGISKTDAFVADHMERWARRQYARSADAPTPIQGELPLGPDDCPPRDPWERAIAQARAEIRALIEEGQLSHNEISDAWVAQWAADLFQAEPLMSSASPQ